MNPDKDTQPQDFIIRPLQANESCLLRDFLYEAIFLPPGVVPPPREVLDLPELKIYIKDFGQTPSLSISLYKEYRNRGIRYVPQTRVYHPKRDP